MTFSNIFTRSIQTTQQKLTAFAQQSDFLAIIDRSFGSGFDAARLAEVQQQWLAEDFRGLPEIEIVDATVLGTAAGGYGASTNRIYLSSALIEGADELAISGVLTEEIGHWLDRQINANDTPGDEGQLFAASVWGLELSAAEIAGIRAEDDTKSIVVNGQVVSIEQANFTGTTGNDTLTDTAGGNDTFYPLTGIDSVNGGAGTDTLIVDYSGTNNGGIAYDSSNAATGSGNFRTFNGSTVANRVTYSNIENLNITGTNFADELRDGNGNDILIGGGGDDTFIDNGQGVDLIDGGVGTDNITLNVSTTTGNNTIDLNNVSNILANGTELRNIEVFTNLTTGAGNDTITAKTGTFNDVINSGAGNDVIDAKDGNNTVNAGDGNDRIVTGVGNDTINGGDNDDVINPGTGIDNVDGGAGTDTLVVDYSGTNNGGIAYDSSNAATGSGNFRTFNGSTVANRVTYSNIERFNITGTNFADEIRGGTGDDILNGGKGNDTINGGAGNDTIIGVNNIDTNPGNAEIDTLTGGADNDIFVLSANGKDFYATSGNGDYAKITDFSLTQDVIQLRGAATDYSVTATSIGGFLPAVGGVVPPNTALYRGSELIAVLQGVNSASVNLTQSVR